MNTPNHLSTLLRQKHDISEQLNLRIDIALAVHDTWEKNHDEKDYQRYLEKMAMVEPLRDQRDAIQKKIDKARKRERR